MEDKTNAILSSDEVERLLESFHEGQLPIAPTDIIEDEGKVKYYDFKRPNTISRDKKRMLYKLYETTAYHISRDISNYLRASIKVNLNSIDELNFEIFKNTCSELVFINTFRLKPLQGLGCITMDLGLCLSILEKAFGGTGKTQNEIRKLTDIEVTNLNNIISIILEKLRSAWEPYIAVNWKAYETTMESRYLNIATDAEVVLLVSFTVNLDYSFGEMKICIPVSSMDYALERLSESSKPDESKENKKEVTEQLTKLLNNAKVVVTGILDEINITVEDLINLKEGDVIRLDNKITDDLRVAVEGKNKFFGKLGLSHKKKAIQITSSVE